MGRIIDRRRVMGSKLPYDAEVEYLECSGTQWIDTGIKSGPPIESIIKVQILATTDATIVGSRNPTRFYILHTYEGWCYGLYNYHSSYISYNNGIHIVESVLHEGEQSFKVDGQVIMNNTDSGTFTDNATVRLFANYVRIRLYFVRLYKLNVLIADFIPVRKDGVGYMYDKVSKQLFGNAGTGAFILGPDKGAKNININVKTHSSSDNASLDVITGDSVPINISYASARNTPWDNGYIRINYSNPNWSIFATTPCLYDGQVYNVGDLITNWAYTETKDINIIANI